MICIGETAEERDRGAAHQTVLRQAELALAGIPNAQRQACLLAYEPVWAIGEGGRPATPAAVAEMHHGLKTAFPDCPLLYGGSVSAENCAALAALPDVDGLFIGRAAWQAEGFLDIVTKSLKARPRQ